MKSITTQSGELLMVESHKDNTTSNAIKNTKELLKHADLEDEDGKSFEVEILGTLSDISEETAKGLVQFSQIENYDIPYGFKDYMGDKIYYSALDSLRSLIESQGMNPETTILILKKGE